MTSHYVVTTERDGEEVPYFFETTWSPELPSFNLPGRAISIGSFEKKYNVIAKVGDICADILLDDFIASNEFLHLCNSVGADYFSVPIDVVLNRGKKPKKEFNFFCVTARLSILDRARSTYELSDPKLSNMRQLPIYERIDEFVLRDDISAVLFFCEEIKEVVCSARFKQEFECNSLKGLTFTPIDGSFTYTPWDDLNAY